jgi:hypothetical protein
MIHALQAAARAARFASMPLGGPRGVVIVLTEDALIVRGWDRSGAKGEVRSLARVTWQEFVANNDLLENAVVQVTGALDRALNG